MTEEKLSKNLRVVIILMAIFGTVLFPLCCMLFGNNVVEGFNNILSSTPSNDPILNMVNNVTIALQLAAIVAVVLSLCLDG